MKSLGGRKLFTVPLWQLSMMTNLFASRYRTCWGSLALTPKCSSPQRNSSSPIALPNEMLGARHRHAGYDRI